MCERNWKRPTKGATHGDGRLHHQTNGRVHREVQHTQVILKTLITYTPSSWSAARRFDTAEPGGVFLGISLSDKGRRSAVAHPALTLTLPYAHSQVQLVPANARPLIVFSQRA